MKYRKITKFLIYGLLVGGGYSLAASSQVKAESSIIAEVQTGQFEFSTTEDGYAIIEKYDGNDSVIEIPEGVEYNGKTYEVAQLSDDLLIDNETVKTVYIPKTVGNIDMALGDSQSLEKIIVDEENPYFSSVDGVLYRKYTNSMTLHTYPQAKKEEIYVLPSNVTAVGSNAFYRTKYVKNIVLSEEFTYTTLRAFNSIVNPVIIYVKNTENIEKMFSSNSFFGLASGSKLVVKTNAMKSYMDSNFSYTNLEVISLEQDSSYAIPSTSLTFTDGSTTKNITLGTSESIALANEINLLPSNTTDSVTWTSNNTEIATVVNTGSKAHTVTTGTVAGQCTITGVTESGKKLVVNITVEVPLTEDNFYLSLGSNKTDNISIEKDDYSYLNVSLPKNAETLLDTAVWTSSNENVISLVSTSNKKRMELQYNGTGTTVLKMTMALGDISYSRSITVTVQESLVNCTISDIATQTYTGNPIKPKFTITVNGTVLTLDKDYKVTYTDNTQVGLASITITGCGNYYGEVIRYFVIEEKTVESESNDSDNTVEDSNSNGTESESNSNNNVTENTNNGTTGSTSSNNTTVVAQKTQSIGGTSSFVKVYGNKAFKLNATAYTSLTYTSSNTNVVKVDKNGKVSIVGVGTAKITITAKETSTYKSATKTVTITVNPKQITGLKISSYSTSAIKITWKKDTSVTGYKVYRYDTNKKKYVLIKTITKNSTVSYTDKKLTSGTTYKYKVCGYKNAQNGSYSSELVGYTKLSTVKIKTAVRGNNKATITWNKVSSATGYEVYRSTSKNGKYTKVTTINKAKTVKYTNTQLTSKKTYYYKVRAYKTIKVNGKTIKIYGAYSTVKAVKIK